MRPPAGGPLPPSFSLRPSSERSAPGGARTLLCKDNPPVVERAFGPVERATGSGGEAQCLLPDQTRVE